MCDTNAVSFIAPGSERNYLVTITLTDRPVVDTVFEFMTERLRSKGSFRFPDTCIYTPDQYVYVSKARVLGCTHRQTYNFFELLRPTSRQRYDKILWSEVSRFGMANDFSRIFYDQVPGPIPYPDTTYHLLSYEIATDTAIVLLSRSRIGPPFAQRTSDGPIYCQAGSNLARIDRDRLVVLTDFEDQVYLTNITLYQDSIEVLYQRRCDGEFGTRRMIIREELTSGTTH